MFLQTMAQDGSFHEIWITKDVLPENLPAFKAEMYALKAQDGGEIRLNFEGVDQFCSWALGVLAVVARRIQDAGGEITVSRLSPNLQRIFMYARLDRSVDVIKDRHVEIAA